VPASHEHTKAVAAATALQEKCSWSGKDQLARPRGVLWPQPQPLYVGALYQHCGTPAEAGVYSLGRATHAFDVVIVALV
jgi:hypothetical protein